MSTDLIVTGHADLTKSKYGLKELAFKATAPPPSSLTRRVFEHFRCPENFFDFAANGKISSNAGYFSFGSTLCYGRRCKSPRDSEVQSSSPYDVLDDVVIGDGKVGLPFNPTEVIDNLRMERYAGNRSSSDVLRRIYYLIRPLTNLSLRKRIQRFNARNWQDASFPHWPVDTTVESLCEALMLLSLQAKDVTGVPFIWFWPRGARGCMMMTHDVETAAGRDFCTEVMNIDDSYGIKASFQIVPEERYSTSSDLIDNIRERGFDVAVQDLNHDGRLFDDKEEFLRRAAIVNQYAKKYHAKGFRAGVLYRRPDWFENLTFSFDMSMPNVAHLDPQRGGCCTVMPYFIGKILELPVTTTQDYSLFHILKQRSIELWKEQIELILAKNGMASFIVHPDYVIDPEARAIYENLLRHLRSLRSQNNIWFALPREVDTWWRSRSQMRVEKRGGSWRVVGEGAERADLAYAKNVDGKLVYELADSTGTV